ncbi:MAG: ATP-dependent helicase UvrD/PcrA, partial [Actinomycetota bacterium]|nr:ATP-dependent helicase UvrD/PcrA [Actinomycetota bacterium]
VPAAARLAPAALSVTGLVRYARCPKQFYWTVVRPLPRSSSAAARLGTEVHRWIEQRADRQLALLEPDIDADADLDPDAVPTGAGVAARLKASFLAGPYAGLDPVRVEAPFVLAVGDELRGSRHLVRGRIDAVYERDGRLELVDFKTGRPHAAGQSDSGSRPGSAMQLDLYGLAAIATWDVDPERLSTTYCWLRTDGPPVVDIRHWDAATAADVRRRVSGALDALAARVFDATPGRWCASCDFQSFCPEGRGEDHPFGE